MIDKHWLNLMINDTPARHKGNTITAKAHSGLKENSEQRKTDRAAGHAFCSRYQAHVGSNFR